MLPKMSEDATTTTTTTSLNKNMTSTLLPSTNNNNNGGQDTPEGRTTRGDHSNSIDTTTTENREGSGSISSTSYKAIRYAHLSTSQKHTNYTQIKSKHRTGKRCYRLNLERPFDITCEQSPLEYGDIFAPWTKEVRPRTRGPSEYCPPRHLGGGGEVWRRLVAFAGVSGGHGDEEEEGSGGSSSGGWFSKSSGGNGNSSSTTEGGVEGGAGWRKLSPTELEKVQRLGEKNSNGEYSFVTYDLYHVKNHHVLEAMNADHQRTLTPSTSLDSESSEDDDAKPKSATVKADETARLFRRSELSLRDKAEAEAKKHAAEMARIKAERQAKEKAEIDALKSIKGPKGMTKRLSKKASFRAKSVMRSLSTSDRTSSSMSNSSSRGGIYEGGNAMTRRKMVSTQAGMIEKAKDVIDEESDDEYDGEKYDDSKKIKNMSLFIVGEYDVLNDLCIDGPNRLKESAEMTDLELLLQNEPCPPPNRWQRKTGWGKCNPSSMYAEHPPKDFDWEAYLTRDGPPPVNPNPRPVMQVKS